MNSVIDFASVNELVNNIQQLYTFNLAVYKTKDFIKWKNWLNSNLPHSKISVRDYILSLANLGFFRLNPEFVHYFLQRENKVRWGGHFSINKDWMHFEMYPNKF